MTLLKRSSPMPVSTDGAGSGVSLPSASRSYCMKTRFRSEEHTSELQSQSNLVCRLLLEKKKHRLLPTSIAVPVATVLLLNLFPRTTTSLPPPASLSVYSLSRTPHYSHISTILSTLPSSH